ncbi:hypothetical protein SBOR_9786 [Sclerotinia borealis F-4128]|uniref:Uncharacterized protein n=1 Tax=Sclerotinia borealis (strain F-4128) TaxID=1432307 RepID=W9C2C0_SCLBF|nr:hypothetical protein SBOR_9786 [Sclerotinia borealis F-4128]
MASSSFRDSMNSLGWSRRDPDLPVNTAQQTGGLLSSIKSLNPFGDSGYVRLPTTEGAGAPLPGRNRREEEEGWFACKLTYRTFSISPHVAPSLRPPPSGATCIGGV